MPQGPLGANVATNPSNAYAPLKLNSFKEVITDDTANYVAARNQTAAVSLKVGAGMVESVDNLNYTNVAYLSTTALAALGTTSIGALYDASVTVGALSTTQVAALASTQLLALTPQTVAQLSIMAPYTSGLVFVPGWAQIATVVYK